MNEERYILTKADTWHILDTKTGIDYDTCETDHEEAVKAMQQHAIYFVEPTT
jgi:hypothetical protein